MTVVTKYFGGNGGKGFPLVLPLRFGAKTGHCVDNLIINGTPHGGTGGKQRDELILSKNEYITSVTIRSGSWVDSIHFETNLNRSWGPFGGKGGKQHKLENIRVIGLGGRSGQWLDQLAISFIEGYQESTVIETNLTAVLKTIPPGYTIETSESTRVRDLSSLTTISSYSVGANISSEYFAELSAGLETYISSETELQRLYEKEQLNSTTIKFVVDMDKVGLKTTKLKVFKTAEGNYWFSPLIGNSNTAILPIDQPIKGPILDFTGLLDSQIPSMYSHKEQKYGQDFYDIQ